MHITALPAAIASPSRLSAEASPPAPPAAPLPLPPPEPSLRLVLEADLGLVVMEFRDQSGQVTQSFPDARQLAAYRAARPPG